MKKPTIHGVKVIYLMLGAACNFNCRHCLQHENKPRIKKNLNPKVLTWLENLVASRPESAKPSIMFWGGEPLLYRPTMKTVVEKFGDRFRYTMVSNGALLTEEDVEWLNQNQIQYVYSNDGANTECVRDKNLFEDENFLRLFMKIENRAVDGVFHAYNQDLYAFWEYVEKKAPSTIIYHEMLKCSSNVPADYAEFDMSAVNAMFGRMRSDVNNALKTGNVTRSLVFMHSYIGGVEYQSDPYYPSCGTGRRSLNIDVNGNVFLCHNQNEIIGTVDDDFMDLYARSKARFCELIEARRQNGACKDCEVFSFCHGGCPFEKDSDILKKTCETRKTIWLTAQQCVNDFKEMVKE